MQTVIKVNTFHTDSDQVFGTGPARYPVFREMLLKWHLAHTIENKVEAAYRRGDLFEKRSVVMQDWANYLS